MPTDSLPDEDAALPPAVRWGIRNAGLLFFVTLAWVPLFNESRFADLQIQVPLWLWQGRETVMIAGGGEGWRQVLRALLTSGRPVYWITGSNDPAPVLPPFTFRTIEPDPEFAIVFPDSPEASAPTRALRQLVPLRIYAVAIAPS